MKTSYHTHNRFCDGRGEIADYVEVALNAGLEAMGVSSHSPLNFPDEAAMRAERLPAYCAEIAHLEEAYRRRLRIHLSLEFDYIPERHEELWSIVASFPFDYLIGSVHFIGEDERGLPWAFDLTRRRFENGLRRYFASDIRQLVGAYYERIRSMAAWGRPAIVGHIDRVKKWNKDQRYFREDESWYRREVEAALQACARAGLIVELNTIGWRNAVRSPYPSPWILRRCLELGIPLVVTTDAHAPVRVTDFHAEAEALLREVACTSLAVLRDDGWRVERS
ncbi:MAG: histidinol-phosphatase [Armatimonadetes bacterium]|nr:histidinol-phosphatase [Armatimonadota bacterium]